MVVARCLFCCCAYGGSATGAGGACIGDRGSGTANDPQHVAGDFESLIGRRLKEEGRRRVVALDAAAMRIHPSQVVLRHHVAQACAVAIQGRSQNLVAYNAFAMLVSNRPKAQAHTC